MHELSAMFAGPAPGTEPATAPAAETNTATVAEPEPVQPEPADPAAAVIGERFHYTGTGAQVGNRWLDYGQEIIITAELIDATRDRFGRSTFLDQLLDPDLQRQSWGRVVWLPGAWPSDRLRYLPGTRQWHLYRDAAYRAAAATVGEQARKAARQEAVELFGPKGASNPADWPAPYGSEVRVMKADGTTGWGLDPEAGRLTRPLPEVAQ